MIRGSVILCVLLGGLGLLPASQAGVYKWTDDQGRVHYSDTPPAKGQAEQVKIRINSYTGPAVISKAKGSPAASPKEVVIYSTAWCGYCKKAKAYLDSKGVRYREVDVETDAGGREEFAKLGGRGVPVILVGESRMDGFSEGGLEGMLKAAGYPLQR
ncbi:MAG TPA: glutaredoxin family protein [Burkholderiales bacterium]|nr:glutaredoxin family protein [Burkholderiales bacterium]